MVNVTAAVSGCCAFTCGASSASEAWAMGEGGICASAGAADSSNARKQLAARMQGLRRADEIVDAVSEVLLVGLAGRARR